MRALLGWKSDAKGRYPVSRVLWNLLWAIPLFVTGLVFVVLVFAQSGPTNARRAAKEIFS